MPPVTKLDLSAKIDHSVAWDWEDQHVSQSFKGPKSQEVSINDIVESGTVLIAAGPADLDAAVKRAGDATGGGAGFNIVPIGLVETAQISMNKPLSRIFEIGSKLSYIIPGRSVGGISLSRVFFDGPSILSAIYAGEVEVDKTDPDKHLVKFVSNPHKDASGDSRFNEYANISSGHLTMNLASSFFEQPLGLAFYFADQEKDIVGQVYFEGCRVSTYNMGISANMNVITESINMEFVRCRPIVTVASEDGSVAATNGQLSSFPIIGTGFGSTESDDND